MAKKKIDETEEKNKGGRPSKFDSVDMRFVRYMARKGATDQQIADELGVHIQTVYKWKKAHPEFFEQLKSWKEEADEVVEKSLYQRAVGYSCKETKVFIHEGCPVTEDIIKHYPPDTTACIFWLKNRDHANWRDRIENTNINLNDSSIEDYLKTLESDNGKESNKVQ